MKLVVDASVALKWFLRERPDEPYLDLADAVAATLDRADAQLFAPVHWTAEVVGVLARIRPTLVDDALLALDDARPRVIRGAPVMKRAAELTIALDHHLFDTLYHAVALETGATLVTADDVYFNKAKDTGAITRLADFAP